MASVPLKVSCDSRKQSFGIPGIHPPHDILAPQLIRLLIHRRNLERNPLGGCVRVVTPLQQPLGSSPPQCSVDLVLHRESREVVVESLPEETLHIFNVTVRVIRGEDSGGEIAEAVDERGLGQPRSVGSER